MVFVVFVFLRIFKKNSELLVILAAKICQFSKKIE